MAINSLFSHIREQQSNSYSPRSDASVKSMLEEEICTLRIRMEKLVLTENSFTSDVVIKLSMLLDDKINEYNELIGKSKK